VDDILRLADLAMYQSKQAGKNTISFYNNELTAKVVSRDVIVRRIRDALAGDQFTFFLQPVIDLKTMTPAGAEALMRLNRSNDGMFSPGDIIRAAEETGLIEAITRWGVAEGLAIAERSRRQLGDQGRYLAVNLSPKQMTRAFINDLVDRLRVRPELARNMVFEITETALFHQGEDVSSLLNDIRSAGARLALDDFGTGYSSLGHLHRFPVDLIKLDRGFVSGLADSSEDAGRRRALIRATSAMAEELGMRVVAEGIEDQATLAMLRDFGIAYGQGFLFSPALPEEAACEWLDRFSRGEKAAPYLKVIG
jgi:EAL domain-containing protein (putative c-di-GMP-specific phosphodiesterase class I)